MNYLGIDPGASGGFALVSEERKLVEYLDLSKGDMLDWYKWLKEHGDGAHAAIEKVGAMPGNGGAGMFNFGLTVGKLHMALVALEIPHLTVTPQVWQRSLGVPKRDKAGGESQPQFKKRLREVAQRLFPTEKVTANIADACLIAYYHATSRNP